MKHSWTAALALALLVMVALRVAVTAQAQGPASGYERELRIERSLACPQCTGVAVDVCDQDICQDMRNVIHEKVAAGESDAAIQRYFVERFGPRVLLAPPKDGANLLAWVVPFVLLLVGALLLVAYFRGARARTEARPDATVQRLALGGYRARAEQEVERFE